ncbi:MAG: DUF805 domain-containing protein [Bacteroidetes bacterium]|nr:DUF805 domain-containing protein [Bacteroidota bacterium]
MKNFLKNYLLKNYKLAFTFKGRISRKEYWVLYFLNQFIFLGSLIALIFTTEFLIKIFKNHVSSKYIILYLFQFYFPFLLTFILSICALISSRVRRMHDIGKSGAWILIPIPYVTFILACRRGENKKNKYGLPPVKYKEKGMTKRKIFLSIIGVMILISYYGYPYFKNKKIAKIYNFSELQRVNNLQGAKLILTKYKKKHGEVKSLLEKRDILGRTALHTVDDPKIAKFLIDNGADIFAKTYDIDPKYYKQIAKIPNIKKVIELHENSVEDYIKFNEQYTPLHTVENIKIIKILIDACKKQGKNIKKYINLKSKFGNTVLHATRNYKIADYVIKLGADVEIKNQLGQIPFHYIEDIKIADLLIHAYKKKHKNVKRYINFKDKYGCSSIFYVKDYKVAEFLIKKGAQVNIKNNYQETPLHNVKNVKIAKLLIDNGADIFALDNYYDSPLHFFVSKEKNEDLINLILSKAKEEGKLSQYVNKKNKYKNSPLFIAASEKYIQLLINSGAKVNSKNSEYEQTPLHNAANEKIAQILIDNGADIFALDKNDDIPLHFSSNYKVTRLLIDHIKKHQNPKELINKQNIFGNTPLHLAEDEKVVKELINNGADTTIENKEKALVLHYSKNFNMTQLLIEDLLKKYSNIKKFINKKDLDGNTPLHLVNDEKAAEILIKNGANPLLKNNYGNTPLISSYNFLITKVLVEEYKKKYGDLKKYINIKNNHGYSALNNSYDFETKKYLIENGADINSQTNDLNTDLHFAYSQKICDLLINNGADILIKNKNGENPLLYSPNNLDKIKTLLKAYNNKFQNITKYLNSVDNDGNTILHLSWNAEVISYLLSLKEIKLKTNKKGNTPLALLINDNKKFDEYYFEDDNEKNNQRYKLIELYLKMNKFTKEDKALLEKKKNIKIKNLYLKHSR